MLDVGARLGPGVSNGRRHPLSDEAKAEHDLAYEEVRRAQDLVVSLFKEYSAPLSAAKAAGDVAEAARLQAELDQRRHLLMLDELFEVEAVTMERLSAVSRAFTAIVGMVGELSEIDRLRNAVFRRGHADTRDPEINKALEEFSMGVWAYWQGINPLQNDRQIRQAWSVIEARLRVLGRKI
jgi:hypothetical protein